MNDLIKQILDYAIWAPSGDNSQPWRFEVKPPRVLLYNLPEKGNPYLDFRERGSFIAHGGVIENMLIAAEHFGYRAACDLFPDGERSNLVATISLSARAVPETYALFEAIKQRHTNRKIYEATSLTSEQRQDILRTSQELGFGLVKLVELPEEKEIAGRAGALAEIVILENKLLHGSFFRDVVWTAAEEKQKRHGLFIDTMEFNLIQKLLFRLAKHWVLMTVGIRAGLPKFIAKEDAKLYATGAAMGIVAMEGDRPADFVNAGRLMQRIWLKATAHHLALQPVTATLFFAQRIRARETEGVLSPQQVEIMKRAYADIQKTFRVTDRNIAMMFRIGRAAPASARSSRILAEEKL